MEKHKKKRATCRDCGNAPTNHFAHKVSVVIGTGIMKLNGRTLPLLNAIEPRLDRFVDWWFPGLFKFLEGVGLGTTLYVPDEHMNMRERVFWEEGERRGVKLWAYRPFPRSNTITVATVSGKTFVFDTIPHPPGPASVGSNWMDDKGMCHKVFESEGIPMARGRIATSYTDARTFFQTLATPVIVKPSRGSRSRHTTTHIETEEELRRAFAKAKQLSPWVMVEEELHGFVHRGTVIGGKVIGILRREPALVMGDGVHSIEKLIAIENENPKRRGPIFHQIEIHSEEHHKELMRQGYSLKSVPKHGEVITLSQKASRGLGGGTTDVTDEAHPDIVQTLEHVARVLKDPLVGIDFILEDVRKPWGEQEKSGVIECNSAPFIDLHMFPLHGKPRNTPGALWDIIFPSLTQK